MNVKKILTCISDEECVVLSNAIGEVVIDKDDLIEEIDGVEYVHIQTGPDTTRPVATGSFSRAIILPQMEFVMMSMMRETSP